MERHQPSGTLVLLTGMGKFFGIAVDRKHEVDRQSAIDISDLKGTTSGSLSENVWVKLRRRWS